MENFTVACFLFLTATLQVISHPVSDNIQPDPENQLVSELAELVGEDELADVFSVGREMENELTEFQGGLAEAIKPQTRAIWWLAFLLLGVTASEVLDEINRQDRK